LQGAALVFVTWFACLNLQSAQFIKLPTWFNNLSWTLHLHQNWALFAPSPIHSSNWIGVGVRGEDAAEDSLIQLHGFGAPDFASQVHESFGKFDWARYFRVLYGPGLKGVRRHFAEYACRIANEEQKRSIRHLNIYGLEVRHDFEAGTDDWQKPQILFSADCVTNKVYLDPEKMRNRKDDSGPASRNEKVGNNSILSKGH
jgi:hypothetical protein